MKTKSQITDEYRTTSTIKTLLETYQEIAAIRMQKVRTSVLANREFLDELNGIYHQLRYSYETQLMEERANKKHKKKIDTSIIKRNGKTIVVLMSSNTGLYGSIIVDIFRRFANYLNTTKDNPDVAIIGRRGLAQFREVFPNRKYAYFALEDHIVISKDISDIVDTLVEYEKVTVFHGKYESILTQIPVESNISGELPYKAEEAAKYAKEEENIKYLYEPSLEKILAFFETEIMASIFEQTVYESNLTKFAARMINLDSSIVNISDTLKKMNILRQQTKHRDFNKKQISTISGISLWS